MEAFIGTILPWAPNFAPSGWAFCNGATLPISQNQALFALLGTTYGGNGTTTFNLPDLRSRLPLGCTNGSIPPGLQSQALGAQGGTLQTTLLASNMPAHNHAVTGSASVSGLTLNVSPNQGTTGTAQGNYIANTTYPQDNNGNGPYSLQSFVPAAQAGTPVPVAGLSGSVSVTGLNTQIVGGSLPFSITPPYTVINYIIALQGIFPTRS